MYAEDQYGDYFHYTLIRKLFNISVLDKHLSHHMPKILRMPAKKCNHKLYKAVVPKVVFSNKWRILFVIDSEGRRDEIAERDVIDHFPDMFLNNIRVVVVRPMHDAWLCIGLGGKSSKCRNDPKKTLEKILGRPYTKDQLARLADKVDAQRLLEEDDFKEYIDGLKWLMS